MGPGCGWRCYEGSAAGDERTNLPGLVQAKRALSFFYAYAFETEQRGIVKLKSSKSSDCRICSRRKPGSSRRSLLQVKLKDSKYDRGGDQCEINQSEGEFEEREVRIVDS